MNQKVPQQVIEKEQFQASKNGIHKATDVAADNAPVEPATWQERLTQDPVFKFVWKWRSQLFACALIILLGVFYYRYSQEAYENTLKDSARVFSEGRAELVKYGQALKERDQLLKNKNADSEKKLVEIDQQLAENLKLARNKFDVLVQSSGSYAALGKVYQLVLDVKSGQVEKALNELTNINYQDTGLSEQQRFYFELAWLYVARASLDVDSLRAKGISILQGLTKQGQSVAVPAAVTLTNIADTEADKQAIKATLESLMERYPEQSELTEEALDSL